MSEKIQTAKIICKGGLNSNQNYLELSDQAPGSAISLINFEPSLYGGYRRINGFVPLEQEYPEVDPVGAEGPILGVFMFNEGIIAARKQVSGATYNFYAWSSGGDWVPYTTGLTLSSTGVSRIRYDTFNFDGTEKIVFVDGVNDATMFDGTNWTDIDPSGTGADFANAGGDQVLTGPKYVSVFKNHIFLAGFTDNEHIVAHSAPLTEYDWDVASGAGQIIAGFAVSQIYPFRDNLYTFGKTKIKKIYVPDTTFVIDDVTTNIGCLSPDSVLEIGGDLLYLSQDGFRPISGTAKIGDVELETVSKNIQTDLVELISTYASDEVVGVTVRRKSQVRYFFSNDSVDVDIAQGIIGGLRGSGEGISWEWGKLLGIRASCATSGYIDTVEYVVHGDFDGCVYRQEVGSSFNGDDILHLYAQPFLDFGDTEIRKTFRSLNIFLRPEGPLDFTTQVRYDWNLPDVQNPSSYVNEAGSAFSLYDFALYDVSLFAGVTIPIAFTNIEGSGRSIQLTFVGTGQIPSFTIQGVVYEFSTDGRI